MLSVDLPYSLYVSPTDSTVSRAEKQCQHRTVMFECMVGSAMLVAV